MIIYINYTFIILKLTTLFNGNVWHFYYDLEAQGQKLRALPVSVVEKIVVYFSKSI